MGFLEDAFEANQRFASAFDPELGRMAPRCKAAVLVCMDARIDPARILGMKEGDANVIRNAGGRTTDDAIRSLVISSHLLGSREFLVVHHTNCGLHSLSNEAVHHKLLTEQGIDCSSIDFLPFADLEESVIEDVGRIASSPYVPVGIPITGLVYEVENGRLRTVIQTRSRIDSD